MHERSTADSGLGREPGNGGLKLTLKYALHGPVDDSVLFVSCQPAKVSTIISLVKEDELEQKLSGCREVDLEAKLLQYARLHLQKHIWLDLVLVAHLVANRYNLLILKNTALVDLYGYLQADHGNEGHDRVVEVLRIHTRKLVEQKNRQQYCVFAEVV